MCPLCLASALVTLGGAGAVGGAGLALARRVAARRRSAPDDRGEHADAFCAWRKRGEPRSLSGASAAGGRRQR